MTIKYLNYPDSIKTKYKNLSPMVIGQTTYSLGFMLPLRSCMRLGLMPATTSTADFLLSWCDKSSFRQIIHTQVSVCKFQVICISLDSRTHIIKVFKFSWSQISFLMVDINIGFLRFAYSDSPSEAWKVCFKIASLVIISRTLHLSLFLHTYYLCTFSIVVFN